MQNTQQNALLLRLNKQEQVKALQELGFSQVTNETPLSEIAMYMRWAGGLADLRLACVAKNAAAGGKGTMHYFTEEQWNGMTETSRNNYVFVGCCIRARLLTFVIAKENLKNSSDSYNIPWGTQGKDIGGSPNYGGIPGLYDITSAEALRTTAAIVEEAAGYTNFGVTGAPAAELSYAFKACTSAANKVDDPNQWYLPSVSELRIVSEYLVPINDFMRRNGGTALSDTCYWTSTEKSSSQAYLVDMSTGACYASNVKYNVFRVRPCCASRD